MEHTDAIVIGSGQGGVPFAKQLAKDGNQVVLFERAQFGGTCVNYGCLPSKAFLASAHAAAAARNAADLGIHARVEVDFRAVMARARKTIQRSQSGVKEGLAQAGVRIIEATAAFGNSHTVQGGGVEVQAPLIVINTGKSPAVPPIPGLDEVHYFTYQTFWKLDHLPPRTLVVGGGYVGVELGQGLARLGSKVHMIERSSRIVQNEEQEVSEALAKALQADGAEIYVNTEVVDVHARGDVIVARCADGRTLEVDMLLVATGRKPNTDALNTQRAGIELDEKGHIKVDKHFATSNRAVYAIGDVTGQAAFTHVSWEDNRRLLGVLAGADRAQRDKVLSYAFFTEPEVGRVGMTLAQAQDAGLPARAATLPLSQVARSGLTGRDQGFFRMVIDQETAKILGATLVGPCAGELVHVFVALIEAGATWHVLEESVHVHPTYAEGLPLLARKFCHAE